MVHRAVDTAAVVECDAIHVLRPLGEDPEHPSPAVLVCFDQQTGGTLQHRVRDLVGTLIRLEQGVGGHAGQPPGSCPRLRQLAPDAVVGAKVREQLFHEGAVQLGEATQLEHGRNDLADTEVFDATKEGVELLLAHAGATCGGEAGGCQVVVLLAVQELDELLVGGWIELLTNQLDDILLHEADAFTHRHVELLRVVEVHRQAGALHLPQHLGEWHLDDVEVVPQRVEPIHHLCWQRVGEELLVEIDRSHVREVGVAARVVLDDVRRLVVDEEQLVAEGHFLELREARLVEPQCLRDVCGVEEQVLEVAPVHVVGEPALLLEAVGPGVIGKVVHDHDVHDAPRDAYAHIREHVEIELGVGEVPCDIGTTKQGVEEQQPLEIDEEAAVLRGHRPAEDARSHDVEPCRLRIQSNRATTHHQIPQHLCCSLLIVDDVYFW